MDNITLNHKAAFNILEEPYTVYLSREAHLNSYDTGIPNERELRREKERTLKEAIKYLSEDLVNDTQEYPQDGFTEVKFTTDFVVLKRAEFEFLKEQFEKLLINEYKTTSTQ